MAMRRVYEDFRPTIEWIQQDLFCVYLPGFTLEDIAIVPIAGRRNIILVGGERLVAGNSWSRFQEYFQAPENCDMSRVLRKFDSGILAVAMPRKTTATQVAPEPEAEAKTEPPSTPYVGADARAEQVSQEANNKDFRPTTEWKQQEESNLLCVYLPALEDTAILPFGSRNIIRVTGNRLVADGWMPFREHYQAPENCDMSRVLRNFESIILTVTLPRKTTATQVAPEAEAKTEPPSTPYVGADARAEQTDGKSFEGKQEGKHKTREMAMRRVYEDFRPTTEWKQQEESDLLLFYLPGFTLEDTAIVPIAGRRNIIWVGGARLVAGNRWIRFQECFQAPENCDMSRVLRNFDSRILTVTLPRKTTATQVAPEAEAKTEPPSTPYVGADARAEQTSQKAKENICPQFLLESEAAWLSTPAQPVDPNTSTRIPSQRTEHEHKHHTGKYQTPPKITPIGQADKQTDGKSFEDARAEQTSQKAKEDIRPQATSSMLDTGKPADTYSSRSQRTEHEHKRHTGKGQTPPKITPIVQADKQTDVKSFEDTTTDPQKVASKPVSQKSKEETPVTATLGTDERKQNDEKAPSESETKEKAFEKTAGRESMRQEKGRDSGAKAKETIKGCFRCLKLA